MGDLFRLAERYIDKVDDTDVFVEIGSARSRDGSTYYLADLSKRLGTILYSVDVDDRVHVLARRISGAIGYCEIGSEWTRHIFPKLHKTIACLYLDNYDYNYWIGDNCQMIQDQKRDYLEKHGLIMNNQDCVLEHLRQMIDLLPYMSKNSLVICDDTYLHNDCWIGKCAAVVPYLLVNGFRVVEIESDRAVMLTNSDLNGIITA